MPSRSNAGLSWLAGRGSSLGHYTLSSMSRGIFVNILHSPCIFGYMQGNMNSSEAELLDARPVICSHFRHLCVQMDQNPTFWDLNDCTWITLKKHPTIPLKSIIRENLHLPLLLPRKLLQSSSLSRCCIPHLAAACKLWTPIEACWMSVVLFTIPGTFALLRIRKLPMWNLNVCTLIISIRRYKRIQ